MSINNVSTNRNVVAAEPATARAARKASKVTHLPMKQSNRKSGTREIENPHKLRYASREFIIDIIKLNCFKNSNEIATALRTRLGLYAKPTVIAGYKSHYSAGRYS